MKEQKITEDHKRFFKQIPWIIGSYVFFAIIGVGTILAAPFLYIPYDNLYIYPLIVYFIFELIISHFLHQLIYNLLNPDSILYYKNISRKGIKL